MIKRTPSANNRSRRRKLSHALILLIGIIASAFLELPAVAQEQCISQDDKECKSSKESPNKKVNDLVQSWFKSRREGLQFLQDKVFGQGGGDDKVNGAQQQKKHMEGGPFSHLWNTRSSRQKQQETADQESKKHEQEAEHFLGGVASLLNAESTTDAFLNLVSGSDDNERSQRTWIEVIKIFREHIKEVKEQVDRAFGDLGWNPVEHFRPVSAFYLLREEEASKGPVWKRRRHRFYPKLKDVEDLKEFHNALYLSELSYVHTVPAVEEGLRLFQNDSWALLYATCDSLPHEPAHFIAIRKTASPIATTGFADRLKGIESILPWEAKKKSDDSTNKNRQFSSDEDTLELILVVRGTKELGDIISDVSFEAVDYREGKAHGGFLQAGKFLVDTHVESFRELLKLSGRKLMRLTILGHSLGGGAAAIAAIEFNDYDFIEASAIGFGSPGTLSPELSAAYQDIITTIVSDADVVPRIGVTSIIHLHLRLMAHSPGPSLWEDVSEFVEDLRTKLPSKVVDVLLGGKEKLSNKLEEMIGPKKYPHVEALEEFLKSQETNSSQIGCCEPPGTCIHFFRDGISYSAAFTPCSYFSEVEFVSTMIDDHMVRAGYHRALVTLARDLLDDLDFRFEHQVLPDTS
ncbi:Lipase (class 3) [Seminavis robusta]|uniref:sn-1-specific diacylglycerol lipase n=1 Tax=Seminavis robusta TaxID=568900 RepID=A0A9N8HFU2_9STRA|nr:Lipase (class 3) [Seminavis robusta]|eukprot:Sro593_g172230.1 Lipase (class 3) (633) ;mRNA; f:8714-10706